MKQYDLWVKAHPFPQETLEIKTLDELTKMNQANLVLTDSEETPLLKAYLMVLGISLPIIPFRERGSRSYMPYVKGEDLNSFIY